MHSDEYRSVGATVPIGITVLKIVLHQHQPEETQTANLNFCIKPAPSSLLIPILFAFRFTGDYYPLYSLNICVNTCRGPS